MKLPWFTWVAAAIAVLLPAELLAQSAGKVAVGVSVSSKFASDAEAHGTPGIGFLYRIGHGKQGWGWKYGLNWYSTEIDRPLAGQTEEFG